MRDFLLSVYPWIKALHIAAVIAWMAGMMYLPRLFIYHHQAEKGGEAERFFTVMERRLLKGIINPAMIAVWLLAGVMLYANPALFAAGWFLVKLPLVLGISAIHGFYARARRAFERGERPRSEKFWRIMNEIPFLMMLVAVFMAVAKPF
ncbi:MAG TPA: protoporphyrinogen oxidase HemJ [Parvularculaceae bacterium]|nr:protoporphyrinogen oxidase HemJ [Parvularculaceae bacterium]HNS85664.1 protoporphyrinogen oxidase HemJ [Parvularculaceae bacterium]